MTYAIDISKKLIPTLARALILLALVAAAAVATASPAGATTNISNWSTAGSAPEHRAVGGFAANTCFEGKNELRLAYVNLSKAPGVYAGRAQTIHAWARLLRWNGASWQKVPFANGSTSLNMGSDTMSAYQTGLTFRPGTVYQLAPGWYSVQLELAWWVDGVGYVADTVDAFNNDVYDRQLAQPSGGEYLNTSPEAQTTIGFCYVG